MIGDGEVDQRLLSVGGEWALYRLPQRVVVDHCLSLGGLHGVLAHQFWLFDTQRA